MDLLKHDVSLQRFSLIVVAVSAWEVPSIKKQLKTYFLDKKDWGTHHCEIDKTWTEIVSQVFSLVDSLDLPENVIEELKDVVFFIGEQIFSWTVFVLTQLGLQYKYAEKIYWTVYGTVDESKIFQMFWQHESNIKSTAKAVTHLKNPLYTIACIFAQEEYIVSHWNEITKALKIYCKSAKIKLRGKIDTFRVVNIGIYSFATYDGIAEDEHGNWNKPKITWNHNRLLYSYCCTGLNNAVKYLIKKKGNNFESKTVFSACEYMLDKSHFRIGYIKRKYLENVLLLIVSKRLEVVEKNRLFYRCLDRIAYLCMSTWPYHNFLLPLFLNMISDPAAVFEDEVDNDVMAMLAVFMPNANHQQGPENLRKRLSEQAVLAFQSCLSTDTDNADPHFNIKYKYCFKLFEKVWLEIPKDLKQNFFQNGIVKDYFLLELYKYDYYELSILVLNDVDFPKGKELIALGNKIIIPLSKKGKTQLLKKFVDSLITSDIEKKNFKSHQFSVLDELLSNEKFDLADKLLNWLADTDDERAQLKKQIDSTKLCYSNERASPNFIDKVLDWQYNGDEKAIKLKRSEITLNGLHSELCKIWNSACIFSLEVARKKCTEFLKRFYKPEEVDFEKIIDNEKFVEIYCDHLQFPQYFEMIDEFLKFCSFPSEKIKKIKQSITDDFGKLVELYIEKHKFKIMDHIVNWISEDENQKRDVLSKFINSLNGIRSCVKILDSCKNNLCEPLQFFSLWVKPYGDIPKMLKKCSKYGMCMAKVKTLLFKLQKDGYVSLDDVKNSLSKRERKQTDNTDSDDEDDDNNYFFDYDSDSDDDLDDDYYDFYDSDNFDYDDYDNEVIIL